MTPDALDPQPLLRFLHERDVTHIIIGGVAVAAHGYPRPTIDLDIVPDPDRGNLARLAGALSLDDIPLRYCGLGHLRTMKQAAGRPRDLDDLEHLPPAER
jgi:hypothetical protein